MLCLLYCSDHPLGPEFGAKVINVSLESILLGKRQILLNVRKKIKGRKNRDRLHGPKFHSFGDNQKLAELLPETAFHISSFIQRRRTLFVPNSDSIPVTLSRHQLHHMRLKAKNGLVPLATRGAKHQTTSS